MVFFFYSTSVQTSNRVPPSAQVKIRVWVGVCARLHVWEAKIQGTEYA